MTFFFFRCLELDGANLLAHMSLAVCYTNESQQTKVRQIPVLSLPALQAHLNLHASSHPASRGKVQSSLDPWNVATPAFRPL